MAKTENQAASRYRLLACLMTAAILCGLSTLKPAQAEDDTIEQSSPTHVENNSQNGQPLNTLEKLRLRELQKNTLLEHTRVSAEQGNASAQVVLGDCYHTGPACGVPKDDVQAARLYRLAADQGNPMGEARLAMFHEKGLGGVRQDDVEALRLYRLAAAQKNDVAQFRIGIFHEEGRGGLSKDETKAAEFYRLAADRQNPDAQSKLGVFYERGMGGLAKDDVQATRFYRLAAARGNAVAQLNLGVFYEHGRGGLPKSDAQAAAFYTMSAVQGNVGGEVNIAAFYESGRGGLARDEIKAAQIYRLAAEQGNVYAKDRLDAFREKGGVIPEGNPLQNARRPTGNPQPKSDTSLLSAAQVAAIGAHVRQCWTYDSKAPGNERFTARMRVTVDENGITRLADIAAEDAGRMSDPRFRSFVEYARRAVLDPKCSNLATLLPETMPGKRWVLDFRFKP